MNTQDKLADALRLIAHLYAVAYNRGHHDTVEGQYTDVLPVDLDTYFADEDDVVEAVAALTAALPHLTQPAEPVAGGAMDALIEAARAVVVGEVNPQKGRTRLVMSADIELLKTAIANASCIAGSVDQMAEAWLAVYATLTEIMPEWIDRPGTGVDEACAAIRELAALRQQKDAKP